jgi:hypothetical protein
VTIVLEPFTGPSSARQCDTQVARWIYANSV